VNGLAIASVNRHGTFFGERFHISDESGAPVHTACIAFGLDRWAAARPASECDCTFDIQSSVNPPHSKS
jgi:hypothetical protein